MKPSFALVFPVILLSAAACSSSSSAPKAAADAASDVGATVDAGGTDSASSCSAAIAQALKPIDSVSKGAVTVVSDTGGVKVLAIDATAGGANAFASNPYIYVNLATGTRVDVTDKTAHASTDWDLALKRYVVFTNSGDGGGGQGGALHVTTPFDAVTAADAKGTFGTEAFFDADCNAQKDAIGGLLTTFSDWYAYDPQTNRLTPAAPLTYVVKGGTGKLFKVGMQSYYGEADGGAGTASGFILLEVAPL
jgi:hypothetical protein